MRRGFLILHGWNPIEVGYCRFFSLEAGCVACVARRERCGEGGRGKWRGIGERCGCVFSPSWVSDRSRYFLLLLNGIRVCPMRVLEGVGKEGKGGIG